MVDGGTLRIQPGKVFFATRFDRILTRKHITRSQPCR